MVRGRGGSRRSARAGASCGFRSQAQLPTASMSTATQIMRAHAADQDARSRCSTGIGSLRGVHNAQNAACAAAAALALGPRRARHPGGPAVVSRSRASHGEVGRKGAVLFVNDSKATNADSAAQALACFTTSSGSPAASRRPAASRSLAQFFPRIRKAYLIGEARRRIRRNARRQGRLRDRRHARPRCRAAARDAQASGLQEPVVLLSPACASFDQYREFRGARRALPGAGAGAAGHRRRSRARASVKFRAIRDSCLISSATMIGQRLKRSFAAPSIREPPWFRAPARSPFADWWWTVDRLDAGRPGRR